MKDKSVLAFVILLINTFIDGQQNLSEEISLVIYPTPGPSNIVQVPLGEPKLISCQGKQQDAKLYENIKWYWPDGREIKQNDDPNHLQLIEDTDEATLSLNFNSFREQETGTYRCTATYAKTRPLDINITLEGYAPIKFVDANEDQYATKDEDYKVVCKVQASPSPRIKWYKDHKLITSSDKYAIEIDGLVVRNVTDSDEGVYKCHVVVLKLGDTKERYITLQVQEKPRIVKIVREVEGIEGDVLYMQCVGEGKPKPEVEWFHRGQDLYATPRKTVNKYTGMLQIDDLKNEDRGDYLCMVTNKAGHDKQSVNLTVVTKPVVEEFLNATVGVNANNVTLTCRARGSPPPDVQFQKDSQNLPFVKGTQSPDRRIFHEQAQIAEDMTVGTLIISDVLRTDDGLYNCIAKNGRTQTEKMGHITVEYPPDMTRTPRNESWSWNGKPANLTCIAEAIPNATITWLFGQGEQTRPIESTIVQHIVYGTQSESVLQITPISRGDFGVYTCRAKNKLGDEYRGILFREATYPGRIQQVITQQITATTVSFKIAGPVTDGGLPVQYYVVQYRPSSGTWDKNEEKLWPIEEHEITIEGLTPLLSYMFRFAAQSEVGRGEYVEKTESTNSRGPPQEPIIVTETQNGIATTSYTNQIEIKWQNPRDNGEKIDEFQISYIPVHPTPNTHHTTNIWEVDRNYDEIDKIVLPPALSIVLDDLHSNKYYRVKVQAHNSRGWSNPSQIIVQTPSGQDQGLSNPVTAAPAGLVLEVDIIIIIAVVIFVFLVIAIDLLVCRMCKKGISYTISNNFCNKKKRSPPGSVKGGPMNGEKHPIPDLEADRFHNPSDLDDIPSQQIVSQPLITDPKANGNGSNGSPAANTFV